jgi:hypothetical protein
MVGTGNYARESLMPQDTDVSIGLVILNASYSAREKGKDIEGLSIDATIPLQALVHASQLHIPALRSKVRQDPPP